MSIEKWIIMIDHVVKDPVLVVVRQTKSKRHIIDEDNLNLYGYSVGIQLDVRKKIYLSV